MLSKKALCISKFYNNIKFRFSKEASKIWNTHEHFWWSLIKRQSNSKSYQIFVAFLEKIAYNTMLCNLTMKFCALDLNFQRLQLSFSKKTSKIWLNHPVDLHCVANV